MRISTIVIPLIVLGVSLLGSSVTGSNMDWYDTLSLPSWTPPGEVIGLVWTTIFVLSAIAAIQTWNLPASKYRTTALFVFVLNAILNVLWSKLFFGLHEIGAAFYEALLLDLSVIVLIVLLWKPKRSAALLLVPYAAWVAFASFLTYNVWMLNL